MEHQSSYVLQDHLVNHADKAIDTRSDSTLSGAPQPCRLRLGSDERNRDVGKVSDSFAIFDVYNAFTYRNGPRIPDLGR